MFAVQLSRDYLSEFSAIKDTLKNSEWKTYIFAVAKIFFYGLLVPLAFVIGYGIPAIFPAVKDQYPKYRINALVKDLQSTEHLSDGSKYLLTTIQSNLRTHEIALQAQVKQCCVTALEFLKEQKMEEAKKFLELAKLCAKLNESRVDSFISNLFEIAIAEQEFNAPNALKTVQEAIVYIEKLDKVQDKIRAYSDCSDRFERLFISLGQYEIVAEEILVLAQKLFLENQNLAMQLIQKSKNENEKEKIRQDFHWLSQVQAPFKRMQKRFLILQGAISVLGLPPELRREKEEFIQCIKDDVLGMDGLVDLSDLLIIAFVQKSAGYAGFQETIDMAYEVILDNYNEKNQNMEECFEALEKLAIDPSVVKPQDLVLHFLRR